MNAKNKATLPDVRNIIIGNYFVTYRPMKSGSNIAYLLPRNCTPSGAKRIGLFPAMEGMEVLEIKRIKEEEEPVVNYPAVTAQSFVESVIIHDKKAVTTSLKVAEIFRKEHYNVLRDIKSLDCSKEFSALNFEGCDYIGENGKNLPMYEMTKNGFVFLVMGYTGEKAAQFKEAYIEQFDRMEKQLDKLKHRARPKSVMDIFYLNHRTASLLTKSHVRRLEIANEKTLAETGVDLLAEQGITTPLANHALKSLLNRKVEEHTVQQLLDAVHYQHLNADHAEKLLLDLFIRLKDGVLYVARKCPLVDDHKAIQAIPDAMHNCSVRFGYHGSCRATVISLY